MKRVVLVMVVAMLGPSADAVAKVKLTPEQRVNRLKQRVAPHYPGLRGVPIHFGKVTAPGAAATTHDIPGVPGADDAEIFVGRGLTKDLRSRDPYVRRNSRRQILWEFGRAIQDERGFPWLNHKTNTVCRMLNSGG